MFDLGSFILVILLMGLFLKMVICSIRRFWGRELSKKCILFAVCFISCGLIVDRNKYVNHFYAYIR